MSPLRSAVLIGIVAILSIAGCATHQDPTVTSSPPKRVGSPTARRPAHGAPAEVLCGVDVLARDQFKPLAGRRVALITNHSGRTRDGRRTVDVLFAAKAQNVTLVHLFSPEHGLYGVLDEKVGNTTDPATGLPVFSLYGKTNRPTAEMLDGVDTLVFDIQDVGARFYTYSATLGNCMQEAARRNVRFVVLDRPCPITGTIVEGPIADKSHFGFTAFGPMPVAHGMTFGELARLYNDAWGIHCDLQVIPCDGWRRDMWYDETGLTWVNPSPNLRNLNAALLYTGVCLLEATNVSVGRGTDQPFEQFGAPWMDARKLSASLNAADLPGVRFVPAEFTPRESKFKDKPCQAVHILVTDRDAVHPVLTGVTIVWHLRKLFPNDFEFDKVERLLQSHAALEAIRAANNPREAQRAWQGELADFAKLRQTYLMYP